MTSAEHKSHIELTKDAPYLTHEVSYRVFVVRIWEKIGSIITALHCTCSGPILFHLFSMQSDKWTHIQNWMDMIFFKVHTIRLFVNIICAKPPSWERQVNTAAMPPITVYVCIQNIGLQPFSIPSSPYDCIITQFPPAYTAVYSASFLFLFHGM